jgi:mRNA-degrading endonuclease YafQ of YafQ-DinJ toxin-antitoxin module
MKHELLRSSVFVRAARRVGKENPGTADDLRATCELLSEDAFHPRLRTHSLEGPLADFWACSAGYDLRVVFSFVESEGKQAILLRRSGPMRGPTSLPLGRLWQKTRQASE